MADSEVESAICANLECKVSQTGRCVEGLELTTCPNYGRRAEDADTIADGRDSVIETHGVRLQAGVKLTFEGASRVMRERLRVS